MWLWVAVEGLEGPHRTLEGIRKHHPRHTPWFDPANQGIFILERPAARGLHPLSQFWLRGLAFPALADP